MSGCARCVWDIYCEEVEVWARNKREVKESQKQISCRGKVETNSPIGERKRYDLNDASSIDLSENKAMGKNNSTTKEEPNIKNRDLDSDSGKIENECLNRDDLMSDLPVGIRELMKLDQKLQAKRKNEGKN